MVKLLKVILLYLLSVNLFADSWQLNSVFKDYGLARNDGHGIHGVVVAPDGNIWVAMNGATAQDSIPHTFTAQDGSDSAGFVHTRPIHVFTPDGEHASYSPIRFVGSEANGNLDTLTYSGKGMCLDHEGHILYTTNELYRFNYMTGEMVHRVAVPFDDAGSLSSLTQPSVDENGNVYLSWVGGATRPVVKISPDFLTQTTVADAGVNYNRVTLVSPDANHIFLGSTWNGIGITVLEANLLGTAYTRVDTIGNVPGVVTASDGSDSSVTHTFWAEVAAWNNGVLWAGETDPAWSSHPHAGSWVGFNPNTGEIIDSIGTGQTVAPTDDASALAATGVTCNPRGLARSNDGLTLYLADYSTNVIQVWTNANPTTVSIEEETEAPIIASGYALYQAYPNPFNPSTKIEYEIGSIGNVKIDIYNLKGELVNTIVNGWHNLGSHNVVWNGKDNKNMQVPSGTYIYRLTSAGVSFSKTVTFVK